MVLDYSTAACAGKVRLDKAHQACGADDLPPFPQEGVIVGDRATGWQRTGGCHDLLCVGACTPESGQYRLTDCSPSPRALAVGY